jgi:hypothetical protein
MQSQIMNYNEKLKTVFETSSAEISTGLDSIDPYKIIYPDNDVLISSTSLPV